MSNIDFLFESDKKDFNFNDIHPPSRRNNVPKTEERINNPTGMKKDKMVGSGTNSRVYSMTSPGGTRYALKRCFKNRSYNFYYSVRELDVNRQVFHPHIISLHRIALGNPFSNAVMSPLKKTDGAYQDDTMHLIYPLARSNLYQFVNGFKCSDTRIEISVIRQYMAEILLGMEYIHQRGFIHRDIKMENVLLVEEGGKMMLKIGDFGLAKPYNKFERQTPGVATSWYRAPEICLSDAFYDHKVDLWSVGCIMYELFTLHPMIGYVKTENELELLRIIIESLPYVVERHTVRNMDTGRNAATMDIKSETRLMRDFLCLENREQMAKIFATSDDILTEYNKFVNLLLKLIAFDPQTRFDATQALEHNFFDPVREYIQSVRAEYVPVERVYPETKIIQCNERTWMRNMAYNIYKNRRKYSWYSDRIMFQAISLFDRSLVAGSLRANKNIVPNSVQGQILSRSTTELYLIACLYLAIKYFSTLGVVVSFRDIAPAEFRTIEKMAIVEKFETTLIQSILDYDIYHKTCYDILLNSRKPLTIDVQAMLVFVLHGHHGGMTPEGAYEFWQNHMNYYISKIVNSSQ